MPAFACWLRVSAMLAAIGVLPGARAMAATCGGAPEPGGTIELKMGTFTRSVHRPAAGRVRRADAGPADVPVSPGRHECPVHAGAGAAGPGLAGRDRRLSERPAARGRRRWISTGLAEPSRRSRGSRSRLLRRHARLAARPSLFRREARVHHGLFERRRAVERPGVRAGGGDCRGRDRVGQPRVYAAGPPPDFLSHGLRDATILISGASTPRPPGRPGMDAALLRRAASRVLRRRVV